MRNLFDFFLKYSSAFLFTILFVISVALLFTGSRYHFSVWLTSANAVSSKMFTFTHGITGYFNLREINSSLQQSNAQLENEVLNLRNQLAVYKSIVGDSLDFAGTKRFDYVLATVLTNSLRHPHNYFTIDKGEEDGVVAGMGVVDQNGIAGVVNVTGPHASRVMSVINASQKLSVKLKDTSTIGSLVWKANDPQIAYMEEVPRHSTFAIGDTVVTTGFSTSFPADIPVGVVMGRIRTGNDNFFTLKVKLATDFNTLSAVRVIKDLYKTELDSLANFDVESVKE